MNDFFGHVWSAMNASHNENFRKSECHALAKCGARGRIIILVEENKQRREWFSFFLCPREAEIVGCYFTKAEYLGASLSSSNAYREICVYGVIENQDFAEI